MQLIPDGSAQEERGCRHTTQWSGSGADRGGPPPIQLPGEGDGGGGGGGVASGRCSDLPQTVAAVTHLLQGLAFDITFLNTDSHSLARSEALSPYYYHRQISLIRRSLPAARGHPSPPPTSSS